MDDHHRRDDAGVLPAISVGTLVVFYMVWAAMHDIAHGESDTTLEYAALIGGVCAFAFLYRAALLNLAPAAKTVWLGGTGLLLFLFDIGAVHVKLNPKYPPDPMLASIFLAAGVPALALIGYQITRDLFHRRSRPGS